MNFLKIRTSVKEAGAFSSFFDVFEGVFFVAVFHGLQVNLLYVVVLDWHSLLPFRHHLLCLCFCFCLCFCNGLRRHNLIDMYDQTWPSQFIKMQ